MTENDIESLYQEMLATINPGWHEYFCKVPERVTLSRYHDMIWEWLEENTDLPERHARLIIRRGESPGIMVRFRYERDLVNFVLRWA